MIEPENKTVTITVSRELKTASNNITFCEYR